MALPRGFWTSPSRATLADVRRVLTTALLALASLADAAELGRWESRAPMGVPRQEIGVGVIGSSLYAVAGIDDAAATAVVERWDAATDTWTPRAPLPVALHHVGVAVVNDILYAIGGLDGVFEGVDDVFAYDPATDAWSPRARLPLRRGAMGVAVVEGRIYAAGGLRNGISVDDFAVYDPATDVWTPLPPMPTARDHLAADAIDGLVYAVGGRDANVLRGALERFDPGTNQWTALAPMPTPRGGLMGAALMGRLYTFGGEGNLGHPSGVFPQTEAYDPARDTWITLEPMAIPRHGTVAGVVGGAIQIPGGATRMGFGVSGAHDAFVPPAADPLDVRRLRIGRRGRLRLRALVPDLPVATPDLPVSIAITRDGGGETILALEVPAGGLRATRRGFVHRTGRNESLRLVRRPNGTLLRLRAVATTGATGPVTVEVALGGVEFRGATP